MGTFKPLFSPYMLKKISKFDFKLGIMQKGGDIRLRKFHPRHSRKMRVSFSWRSSWPCLVQGAVPPRCRLLPAARARAQPSLALCVPARSAPRRLALPPHPPSNFRLLLKGFNWRPAGLPACPQGIRRGPQKDTIARLSPHPPGRGGVGWGCPVESTSQAERGRGGPGWGGGDRRPVRRAPPERTWRQESGRRAGSGRPWGAGRGWPALHGPQRYCC